MEHLKRLRERQRFTQEEVANAVSVSRSTVAMWETGKTLPRGETMIKLADLFGCTIDELYSRDPPTSPSN